jgi:glyoxylase-like metal-dependent hydrolase (beta-lactamase superfamily II)
MKIHTFSLGPFQTNSYIIEDEQAGAAILVDPTIDSESMYEYIVQRKLHVSLIANTHGHIDHVFGNAFFKHKTGAPLAIHEADVPLLAGMVQQARLFGLSTGPVASPDRLLAHGDVIAAGGLSFRVIHTPGHTPGGVCFYGHGILIAGDTLFAGSIGRTDLPGGDYETLIASIKERLLVLPGETIVYSGHGEPTTIVEEKKHNPFLE